MSEQPGPDEPPSLEEMLRHVQGVESFQEEAIMNLTAVHARWRRAWRETGEFSDEESFELVRIMVAAGVGALRSLALS